MDARCRIELLGRLRATQGDAVVTRFRARRTGALLAYLAYYLDRPHPREVLIDLLWPEVESRSGRSNLSRELTSLRRQLEPPGMPAGGVVVADRDSVQLNPAACVTDVKAFEAALQIAARARGGAERVARLTEAAELYRGELLPGYFEDWILPERQRLAELYLRALEQLTASLEQTGDHHGAIQWARKAVAADPLREEAHHVLIRLLQAAGRPASALRQYQELERLLAQELGAAPAPEIRNLFLEVGSSGPGIKDPSIPAASAVSLTHLIALSSTTHDAVRGAEHRFGPQSLIYPPTGTVTFLLAEIDDGEALEGCHHWLRSLLLAHGGYELQAASGMLQAAFARASDALAAAVAAQQAVESRRPGDAAPVAPSGLPPPVDAPDVAASSPSLPPAGGATLRMALYTAEVAPDKQAQHSPALQHATRLLLAAHPGQILLSEKSAVLLRGDLEPGVHLRDLGRYRLRDDAPPESLFQACFPDIPAREFLPPNALPAHEGSLPLQFTRFFGREEEIALLKELLRKGIGGEGWSAGSEPADPDAPHPASRSRLITLTGPGGSGKTRLALEVAGQLRTAFHGAIWFVPLQDVADARLIPDKLLDVLRLPRSPQLQPMEQAAAFLSRQPSLLLLDNFEHLVTDGVPLVQTLLEQVPTLTCLITSRQRLNMVGEKEFTVTPLPVPGGKSHRSGVEGNEATADLAQAPCSLIRIPSVALFVDRAQAVRPDFQITRMNGEAVARLCARLEGLPLALVLAAARVGVMTPEQMLARLEQRLDLLVTRQRGAVTRHRSLRAALDWSHQLLSPELQRFFARLSVFRGGWTLAAAESVCDEQRALEYLEQLRECSLVLAEETKGVPACTRSNAHGPAGPIWQNRCSESLTHPGAEMRFRLLETLREYSAEQLALEERVAVRRRHLQYYLALAEQVGADADDPEHVAWLDRLEKEHDNVRAALTWSLESDVETGLRLATVLSEFWMSRDHYRESREWLGRLLERGCRAAPALRAPAFVNMVEAIYWLGDYTSVATLGLEGLALAREAGDLGCISKSLLQIGIAAHWQGDSERAVPLLDESLIVARQSGNNSRIATTLLCRGIVAYAQRQSALATAIQEESLMLYRQAGNKRMIVYPLTWLSNLALNRGVIESAKALSEEAMILARETGYQRGIAVCLESLARLRKAEGQVRQAVRVMAAADRLRTVISTPVILTWQAEYQLDVAEARAQLGEETFAAAWAEGEALSWQQAAAEALEEVPAGATYSK
jgi:predicted ATPase/DNA-binding SARP family transcriptional activator